MTTRALLLAAVVVLSLAVVAAYAAARRRARGAPCSSDPEGRRAGARRLRLLLSAQGRAPPDRGADPRAPGSSRAPGQVPDDRPGGRWARAVIGHLAPAGISPEAAGNPEGGARPGPPRAEPAAEPRAGPGPGQMPDARPGPLPAAHPRQTRVGNENRADARPGLLPTRVGGGQQARAGIEDLGPRELEAAGGLLEAGAHAFVALLAQVGLEVAPPDIVVFPDGVVVAAGPPPVPLAETIRARQAEALRAGTRAAAAAAYVDLASQPSNDLENVHDVSATAFQAAIVRRLRADQGALALPGASEVLAWLRAEGAGLSDGRPALERDALAAAAAASQGTFVVALGATDTECLCRVWLRADDPRNAANRGKLRQALFDALASAWETGLLGRAVVCPNGRAGRILGALALLDWDERNWEICRLEELKAGVFRRALGVIAAEAARAAADANPAVSAAGRALLARSPAEFQALGPPPEAESEALAERIRAAIAADVDEFARELNARAEGALPARLLAALKAEAQAAVV